MTMDKQHGKYIFICDTCDDTLETNEDDFHAAVAVSKREGWKAKRIGDQWSHSCGCDE